MTSPTPSRATDGQQAGGQSRDLPQRIDQSQLAKDVKQAALFVGFLAYLATYAGFIG